MQIAYFEAERCNTLHREFKDISPKFMQILIKQSTKASSKIVLNLKYFQSLNFKLNIELWLSSVISCTFC